MRCCWWSAGAPGLAVPALLGAWKNSSDPRGWWLGDRCWWGCCPGLGTQGLGPVLVEQLAAPRSCKSQLVGLEGAFLKRRMPEIRS